MTDKWWELPMTVSMLDQYQRMALETAIYPGKDEIMGKVYCALKLNGEAGEVAEKLGKILRDENGVISEEKREALILELGDVMWYVASLARELDTSLSNVARKNLDKLKSRLDRGKLSGSGDNR